MHKWYVIFTPLKLARVIWSQPGTQVSLLPLSRQRREGKTLGTWLIWPDTAQTRAWATFIFCVRYVDASTDADIKRKKKCAWPCACFYAYVGSFSRHVLFYLHLCLSSWLYNYWKLGFYARTNICFLSFFFTIATKQFLGSRKDKLGHEKRYFCRVCFWSCRFLFRLIHPQDRPFFKSLLCYIIIAFAKSLKMAIFHTFENRVILLPIIVF